MERKLISGSAKNDNVSAISVVGLKDVPGMAYKVFSLLAEKNIIVDIIVQTLGLNHTKDITFVVEQNDVASTIETLKIFEIENPEVKIIVDQEVSKISVLGVGMVGQPGVAAKVFEVLADVGISTKMISTSEMKISVVIPRNYSDSVFAKIKEVFLF